jgi:LPXTG-motif cell wall-anchored protein
MSENKKNIWLAVAGVGALIGAALLYHYASGNSEGEDTPSRDELV